MISSASTPRYVHELGEKCVLMNDCVPGANELTVCGSASSAAAKITGMTPAMFTRSGM